MRLARPEVACLVPKSLDSKHIPGFERGCHPEPTTLELAFLGNMGVIEGIQMHRMGFSCPVLKCYSRTERECNPKLQVSHLGLACFRI